ncbi:MAG: hypothetical protein LBT82_01195 [Oscillospiraceae bacterium]|nr:hypothetical protein [Oscillospiraceae bacterium]
MENKRELILRLDFLRTIRPHDFVAFVQNGYLEEIVALIPVVNIEQSNENMEIINLIVENLFVMFTPNEPVSNEHKNCVEKLKKTNISSKLAGFIQNCESLPAHTLRLAIVMCHIFCLEGFNCEEIQVAVKLMENFLINFSKTPQSTCGLLFLPIFYNIFVILYYYSLLLLLY